MNKFKKLLAAMLALALAVAFAMPAMAEDTTYSITIDNAATGHTYEAYQIFTGDLDGNVLSNVKWGSGVNSTALTADSDFTYGSTAAEAAAALATSNAKDFAAIAGKYLATVAGSVTEPTDGKYVISGLNAGYYLIKDKDTTLAGVDDSYTTFILQVVKDVNVEPKSGVPSVEKKVQENAKEPTSYTSTTFSGYTYSDRYNDVADWNIGDAVPFMLTGSLPTNYADYTTYNYVFHDTASGGLTINADSVKVYVNNTNTDAVTDAMLVDASYYTVANEHQSMTVTFADLKKVASVTATSKIVVKYTATLNESAVIGLNGNPNEVYLSYSNNPNNSGEGNSEKGQTPTDKVIVFTYELDTTKVAGENHDTKLEGAEFKLYKTVNGSNKYATVENGKLTGWADTEAAATALISGANGLFKVAGLDAGEYYLKETKAPAGYNLLADAVKLTITATTTNDQSWNGDATNAAAAALTKLTITVGTAAAADGDTATGIVSATIENNKGATLPSTGGMGTTLFTVLGLALMGVAAVLLVAKRRSNR